MKKIVTTNSEELSALVSQGNTNVDTPTDPVAPVETGFLKVNSMDGSVNMEKTTALVRSTTDEDPNKQSTENRAEAIKGLNEQVAISVASSFGLFFISAAYASVAQAAVINPSVTEPSSTGSPGSNVNTVVAENAIVLSIPAGHLANVAKPQSSLFVLSVPQLEPNTESYLGPGEVIIPARTSSVVLLPQTGIEMDTFIGNYLVTIARSEGSPVNVLTAGTDHASVTMYDTLDVPASGVLMNDTQTLPIGTLSVGFTGTFTSTLGATGSLFADGSYTYDPSGSVSLLNLPLGTVTQDSFTYTLTNGQGDFAQGQVIVDVTGMMSLVVGTQGADNLNGSYSFDVVIGDPGNPSTVDSDIINTGDDNDVIFGDVPNSDSLNTPTLGLAGTHDGAGYAALLDYYGTPGQVFDALRDPATALLYNDNTVGAADTIDAGAGNDIIFAQGGDDIVTPGLGDDIIYGGNGSDTLIFGDNAMQVNLVTGTASGEGNDTFSSIENVTTGAGNDVIIGDANDNVLIGGAGNDTFTGGLGNDTLGGGLGADTADYNTATLSIIANLNTGIATGVGTDTLISIENLIGGSGNDTLTGDAGDNNLTGGLGNDTLTGGLGTDTLNYGGIATGVTVTMNATVAGRGTSTGQGTDAFTGMEVISGSTLNDTFIATRTVSSSQTFDGNSGTDTVSYTGLAAANAVVVDLSNPTGSATVAARGITDTLLNIDNAIGGSGADTFMGNADANTFTGGSGTDTADYSLASGAIQATMASGVVDVTGESSDLLVTIENVIGSQYDDTILSNSANITNAFSGGLGLDTVDYSSSTAAITANLSTSIVSGAGTDTLSSIENITTGTGNDTVTAAVDALSISNTFDANAGTDTISYAPLSTAVTIDLYLGQASGVDVGIDRLFNFENAVGGSGADTLVSNSDNNSLTGGAGEDWVSYANAANGVTVSLSADTAMGDGSDTFNSIEHVIGSTFNDTFINDNSTADNTYVGHGGIDTVSYATSGAGSPMVIDLALGTATGRGNDVLTDITNAIGGSGADTFMGNADANTFTGGSGTDTVDYSSVVGGGIVADLSSGTVTGQGTDTLVTIERVVGTSSGDTFISGSGSDSFVGGLGTDTLSYGGIATAVTVTMNATTAGQGTSTGQGTDAFTGMEVISGSTLNDTFIATRTVSSSQTFEGVSGTDTVSYNGLAAANAVVIDLSNPTGSATVAALGIADTLLNIDNAIGGSGADTFMGNADANTFTGGSGTDTADYSLASGAIQVTMASGVVDVTGESSDLLVTIENVVGSQYDDTFINANSTASNSYDGGLGMDLLDYSSASAAITANLNTGVFTGRGTDTVSNIENITTGTGNDTVTAAVDALSISNTFDANAGTDTISYAPLSTAVIIDLYNGQASGVDVGIDTLLNFERAVGGSGDDTLVSNSGNNSLTGGAGEDWVSYANAANGVTVSLSADTATGDGSDTFNSIEHVIGSTFNDTFINDNSTVDNTYVGHGGIDTVSYATSGAGSPMVIDLALGTATGRGNDVLTDITNAIGGSGADTFMGNADANTFTGGGGSDTADYSLASGAIQVTMASGVVDVVGEASDLLVTIENVIGSQYDDTFINANSTASNSYSGGLGIDTVDYSLATVVIRANLTTGTATGRGTDTLSDIENLIGGSGNDTLVGDTNSNTLVGGAGTDLLQGGDGDDLLYFDTVSDTLQGGTGGDTLLSVGLDMNLNTMLDTQLTGIEKIDLATNAATNTLTLSLSEVLNISDTDTLLVTGNSTDAVVSTDTWVVGGTATVDGHDYNIYTATSGPFTGTLLVDINMDNTGIII